MLAKTDIRLHIILATKPSFQNIFFRDEYKNAYNSVSKTNQIPLHIALSKVGVPYKQTEYTYSAHICQQYKT